MGVGGVEEEERRVRVQRWPRPGVTSRVRLVVGDISDGGDSGEGQVMAVTLNTEKAREAMNSSFIIGTQLCLCRFIGFTFLRGKGSMTIIE